MADKNPKYKLRNTIKYPTSLVINGMGALGLEIADSLLEQGGYVILIDAHTEANIKQLDARFAHSNLVSLLDYSAIPHLEEDLRRLDYVFYLAHEQVVVDAQNVSTQEFLKYSNYLDTTLGLTVKFGAKFLLCTSIKANQMLLSQSDFDINFGKQAKSHTVYTDVEIQRYAESLSLEYHQKADLDARVVRVGEIIGKDMDFTRQTILNRLLLQAAAGQDLQLTGDGLDADWYVHLLDAAYGVIKAQFASNTKGQIFSIAYESSVTSLSLAYKIQELDPEPREVMFMEDTQNLASLRLHKPAPNLTTLGWKPKIELEAALKGSYDQAKSYWAKLQSTHHAHPVDKSVVGKLKSFLNIAQQGDVDAGSLPESGPVSRLIAERKKAEQLRSSSLDQADEMMKRQKASRLRTPVEQVRAWLWRNILDSSTNFPVLRRLTPGQFVAYFTGFIVFAVLYFVLLAPAIAVGRDVLVINSSLASFEQIVRENRFLEMEQAAATLQYSFEDLGVVLSRYQGVAGIVAAGDSLNSLLTQIDLYSSAFEGMRNIGYALNPLGEYLNRYVDNTRFRPNSDSYLSAGTSTDYSPILDELEARRAYAEIGAQQLGTALQGLAAAPVNLPSFLATPLQQLSSRFSGVSNTQSFAQLAYFAADMLGNTENRTYLLLFVDNARPMPIGGELAAFALVTMQNGAVSEVKLQSIDTFTPDLSTLPKYAIDEINLHATAPKAADTVQVADLALIGDVPLFADTVTDLWSAALGRQVDSLVLANLNMLDATLPLAQGAEVEGETFNGDDTLQNLSQLQTENQTLARRHDIIAQLWARVLDQLLDNYQQQFVPLLGVFAQSSTTKDLMLPVSDLAFSRAIHQGEALANVDMSINIFMQSNGLQISPERYPAFNQALALNIGADSAVHADLKVKFPSISGLDAVGLCLPAGVKDLVVQGIPTSRVRTALANNKECVVVDIQAETELSFSWGTLPFESLDVSEYNLSFGQARVSGAEQISDLEISLSSGLQFQKISPPVAVTGEKIVFTENLQSDQIVELTIGKS